MVSNCLQHQEVNRGLNMTIVISNLRLQWKVPSKCIRSPVKRMRVHFRLQDTGKP